VLSIIGLFNLLKEEFMQSIVLSSFFQAEWVNLFLWTVVAYLLGSIPFSLLITKLATGSDIRNYGDGNPGAYNAWQAGGWKAGMTAVALDVGKGFLPVLLAQQIGGLSRWELMPVAFAPVVAHAFSPLLHFRKAKAVAATLGVWLALTGLNGIIAFALMAFLSMATQDKHAWVVISGMCGILLYCIFITAAPWLVSSAAVNMLLLCGTHRRELLQPVHLHNRVGEYLVKRKHSS
jgi:glycerol-3-phosphate acyltransferase PlsY